MAEVTKQPSLDRLLSTLQTTGLSKDNPGLYQVIKQLIQAVRQFQSITSTNVSTGSGNVATLQALVTALQSLTYLTVANETSLLANSRMMNEGHNITFDDSTPNIRLIETGDWSVLTNGDPVTPELVFADGDVIMTYVPNP